MKPNNAGVTLVELVVAVAVVSVLASITVPAFERQLRIASVQAEAQKIFSLLARARVEAIRRNRVVTLCRSMDGRSCRGSWSRGWLLFVDENRNGKREPAERLLAVGRPEHGCRVRLAAFGSSGRIRFSPVGFTLAGNGTFRFCPPGGDNRYARAVIVNKAGRPRLSRDTDGDGIHEDAAGRPLTCP